MMRYLLFLTALFFILFPGISYAYEEEHCLAMAIYYEARSEPLKGQAYVADVILNRVEDRSFPNTICGVVTHSKYPGELHKCQFSFYCDGKPERFSEKLAWRKSKVIAKWMIDNRGSYYSTGSLFYHADYVEPRWSKSPKLSYYDQVGRHIFYTRNIKLANTQ